MLLSEKGDVLIQSALTDDEGKYILENIDKGSYKLKIIMLGYQSYSNNNVVVSSTDIALPKVVLVVADKKLKQATVRGVRDLIEVRADKLIVNVENSIVNAGGTALEVLSRSPNVNVDQNDNISIKEGAV